MLRVARSREWPDRLPGAGVLLRGVRLEVGRLEVGRAAAMLRVGRRREHYLRGAVASTAPARSRHTKAECSFRFGLRVCGRRLASLVAPSAVSTNVCARVLGGLCGWSSPFVAFLGSDSGAFAALGGMRSGSRSASAGRRGGWGGWSCSRRTRGGPKTGVKHSATPPLVAFEDFSAAIKLRVGRSGRRGPSWRLECRRRTPLRGAVFV